MPTLALPRGGHKKNMILQKLCLELLVVTLLSVTLLLTWERKWGIHHHGIIEPKVSAKGTQIEAWKIKEFEINYDKNRKMETDEYVRKDIIRINGKKPMEFEMKVRRFWWYRKCSNVKKKWSCKAKATEVMKIEGVMVYGAGEEGERKIGDTSKFQHKGGSGVSSGVSKNGKESPPTEDGRNFPNLHFKMNGKLFQYKNVRGDGWCFYSSLCVFNHEQKNTGELRKMLAEGCKENSETRSSIEAFFEKEQIIGGITREEARRKADRYHLKVKSRQRNVSTWGGTIDATIYSLLTGKRVFIISNTKQGFNVVVDTKGYLEELASRPGWSNLTLPRWKDHEVSYLFWHHTGDLCSVDNSKNDHYAALIPVDAESLVSKRHWIFEGGSGKPISVASIKKRKSNPKNTHEWRKKFSDKKKSSVKKNDREKKKKKRKEENQESRENRLAKKQKVQAEKASLIQNLKKIAVEITDLDITPQELKKKLEEHKKWQEQNPKVQVPFFQDSNKSIFKSVLQFYLNSGCLRFGRWKDHSKKYDREALDHEEIFKELEEETLSDAEVKEMMIRFLTEHSWTDSSIFSCGCCGWREHESSSTKYVRYRLTRDSPLYLVSFSDEEEQELKKQMENPLNKVTIPMDSEWKRWSTVNTWEARSYFEQVLSDGTKRYWHLHRELVERNDGDDDDDDSEGGDGLSVMVCRRCAESLKKNNIPKYSIKNGIDFGWFMRLGLTMPNLTEQLILARNRLYYTAVKISSSNGAGQDHDGRSLGRMHAIMFPHNAPEVATNVLQSKLLVPGGLLDETQLRELFQIFFVTEKGDFDRLMKQVFGTTRLLPRSYVLGQWLLVLKALNLEYADIDVTAVREGLVKARVGKIIDCFKRDVKHISDKSLIEHEKELGCDVERDGSNNNAQSSPGTDDNEDSDGIRCSFVPIKEDNYLTADGRDYREQPFKKFCRLDKLAEEDSDDDEPLFTWTLDDLEEWLLNSDTTESRRKDTPLNDFVGHDSNLTRAFPHVFMLGRAYGKCVPSMNLEMREHLLNQFTLTPARDKRLLGFLFNTLQRSRVLRGVSAFVDSNLHAVNKMRKLLNSRAERQKLHDAMEHPQLKSSKKLLRDYMGLLRYIARDVEYGGLQGTKLKHRSIGLTNRFSHMNCFFTLSPNNLGDPRSVRLACRSMDNTTFPSQYDEKCRYGRNGSEFLEHLAANQGNILWEGNIELPEAFTRRFVLAQAKDNPVAFVNENKKILFQIMDLLIGLKPCGGGYRSKMSGESSRRTRYYKESQKKGFLGHALTLIGVTEDHQRGHLHWHFTVNAGISAWAMSRYACVQEICDKISAALDKVYTTELSGEMHTAVAVTSTINNEKVNWDLDQGVVDAVQGRDPMFVHPDKLTTCMSWKDGCTFASVLGCIQEHGATRQYHKCQSVCFNYGSGYLGCRFCHPRPLCNCTQASVLAACDCNKETDPPTFSASPWWPNGTRPVVVRTCSVVSEDSGSECVSSTASSEDSGSDSVSYNSSVCSTPDGQFSEPELLSSDDEASLDWREVEKEANEFEYDPYELRKHPLCGLEERRHHLIDILDNKLSKHVVYWETGRKALQLPPFLWEGVDRATLIGGLKEQLRAVHPYSKSHSDFWEWVESKATAEQLESIRVNIQQGYRTGNGNVSAFNPIVAFCTGAHHNVEFLGSLEQAKNAMFYLMPYQSKNKFPIKEAFPIIQQSMEDVQHTKSQTVKDDGKTVDRKVKQALERIINKINCRMELSEYQVVAALLELPSMIVTDTFEMGNPSALVALRTVLELKKNRKGFAANYCQALQEGRMWGEEQGASTFKPPPEMDPKEVDYDEYDMDDEFIDAEDTTPFAGVRAELDKLELLDKKKGEGGDVSVNSDVFACDSDDSSCTDDNPKEEDDEQPCTKHEKWCMAEALRNHGCCRKIHLNSTREGEGDSKAVPVLLVPQTLLYLCRGDALAWLNYYEYLGCVKFVASGSSCPDVNNFRDGQKFPMHPDFEGAQDSHHQVKLKQTTPLLSGKVPRHPGPKPWCTSKEDFPEKLAKWKIRADAYARHYLVLFRPECIDDKNLGYSWEDLEAFIIQLQEDDSFISKSRLMIMENHMRGLKVSKTCDVMMKLYRSRTRHMWTEAEQCKYRMATELRKQRERKSLWDTLNNCDGGALSDRELHEVRQQIDQDEKQTASLSKLLDAACGNISARPGRISSSCVSHVAMDDVYEKSCHIRSWKPSDKIPAGNQDACSPTAFIKRKIEDMEARNKTAAAQQVEFFELYANEFAAKGLPAPRMTLLHGPPGVGKSALRDALIKTNAFLGNYNLKTAAFAINTIGMQGLTTASLICKEGKQVDVDMATNFNPSVIADLRKQGLNVSSVVFVEEVSTQAPLYIARLSELCKEVISGSNTEFAGCHVIFIGDFTQLGPVLAGKGIPQAVFDVHGSSQLKRLLRHRQGRRAPGSRDKKAHGHPYRTGVDIFTKIRWFELNIQQRAITDKIHSKFVEDTYFGEPLHLHRIKDHIKLLSEDDMKQESWAEAPVLVATNRERYSIIHSRAVHLAKIKNTVVIRWLKDFRKWQNKPGKDHYHEALQDPCFYEYFVPGMNGFISKNVSKQLHVVNGKKIQYDSIRMDEEWQQWLQDRIVRARPGDIITLPEHPVAVNVSMELDSTMTAQARQALTDGSIATSKGRVTIPITPLLEEWPPEKDGKAQKRVPVYGGKSFGPSRVQIRNRFPLQSALATTVHKAQGDTLDKAIIAMSHNPVRICNFTYEQVHVAFSRVKDSSGLRLLLTGNSVAEKWQSITYISTLRQDPTVAWYFMGFRERLRPNQGNPNTNWTTNEWSAARANQNYMMHLRGFNPWGETDL